MKPRDRSREERPPNRSREHNKGRKLAMNAPKDLLYSKEHEWIKVENEQGTVGVTDYAQEQLGDVVFVELPEAGTEFDADSSLASLESVKAVSDVYSPVSGTVVEANEALVDSPELVNEDPYGRGWIVKLRLTEPAQLTRLLSAEAYAAYVSEESE